MDSASLTIKIAISNHRGGENGKTMRKWRWFGNMMAQGRAEWGGKRFEAYDMLETPPNDKDLTTFHPTPLPFLYIAPSLPAPLNLLSPN